MAKCKDCIHENVCNALRPKGLLPYQSENYSAELFCLEFKNKADVVEVQHGEWLDVPYPNNPNWEPRKMCSICGRFVRRKTENYCPSCGAKMDGGKE